MVTLKDLAPCVRSQFYNWDKKMLNSWYLTDHEREEGFCKELGILVLLNASISLNISPERVQRYLDISPDTFYGYMSKLNFAIENKEKAGYWPTLRDVLVRKTRLSLNCYRWKMRNLS